eukprot:746424-Hanusia_phi.AAC.3
MKITRREGAGAGGAGGTGGAHLTGRESILRVVGEELEDEIDTVLLSISKTDVPHHLCDPLLT